MDLKNYIPEITTSEYSKDYVPIKDIRNGIVITKDNRFQRILELFPVNFDTLPAFERDDIIADFGSWLKLAPASFQIKMKTETSDPSKDIKRIKDRCIKANDKDVSDLIESFTAKMEEISFNNTVVTKFYIIVTLDSGYKRQSFYEVEEEFRSIQNNMSVYFGKIGNIVAPLGESEDDEIIETINFFYKFFNPRTSANEHQFGKKPVSVSDRVSRLRNDYSIVYGNSEHFPDVDEIVAPKGIDFSDPECICLDGMYYTFLLIAGDSYPVRTYAGWFLDAFSFSPGDSVDLFVEKKNKQQFLSSIKRGIQFGQVRVDNKDEFQDDYEKSRDALDAARDVKERLAGNELPFFVTGIITISEYSYDELIKRRDSIIDIYYAADITLMPLKYRQRQAFLSTVPGGLLNKNIYEAGKRNVLTSGLASFYPFKSSLMNDKDGIFFGVGMDPNNPAIAMINPFYRKKYKNANMVILGVTGSGKTYTEHLTALRMRAMGIQCFVLAPEKAHEYIRGEKYGVNGEFIKISPSSKSYINIMEIRPMVSSSALTLMGEEAENTILVAEKATAVSTFLALMISNLTDDDLVQLDSCIVETYKRFGITENNSSIFVNGKDDSEGLKKMPVLEDLYNVMMEKSTIQDHVLNGMRQFITGTLKAFNNQTNVNLDNKYIVFDLSSMDQRILPGGMFLALDFVMSRIKEDVTEPKMIFIDEAWKLIGSGSNILAADYVKKIVKLIRAYNGGTCISTQDVSDFFALNNGEYGEAILANSQIKVILGMDDMHDISYFKDAVGLTFDEIKAIRKYKKGQCLVCANSSHIPIQVVASNYEDKLITTDPTQVKEIENEIKKYGKVLR